MISKLVYFVCYAIIALLIAWALTVLVDVVPFIPGVLKEVLNVVIWVIAIISVILLGLRMFAASIPGPTP